MKPTFWIAVLAAGISLWAGAAFAQQDLPAARWINPGARNNANQGDSGGSRGGHRGGHVGGQWVGGAPSGGTHAAGPNSSGFPSHGRAVGSVTDQSFAGRLGRTVGGQFPSGVTGFGNINSPGQPGIQPLPTGSGFPNINFPGGTPGMHGGLPDRRGGRHRQGHSSFGGVYGSPVIYYGVPYYVPVYTEVVPVAPPAPEPPRAYDIRQYESVIPSPAQPQQEIPPQAARTVTLLAFKDSMVIAVTDYWMQGYSLVYETSLGVRTVVPLDRLDWGLTQQLNFERNVPFVLEARP